MKDTNIKDSYLGLALGNSNNCDIVTTSYYTIKESDMGKYSTLTFSQVRLDPTSNLGLGKYGLVQAMACKLAHL